MRSTRTPASKQLNEKSNPDTAHGADMAHDSGVAKKTTVVAEIGTAHGGDIAHAERLIAAIAKAGADAIKTQIVFADEIVHPAAMVRIGGASPVSIHQQFSELERPLSFYRQLTEICHRYNTPFFASVFGERSLQYAIDIGCPQIKIASPELNHIPLLELVARTHLPVILSSGVSLLADIEYALDIIGKQHTTLLHCVTSYPANPTDYNLRILPHYTALFSVPVGVSDHSIDPLLVPLISVKQGGVMIEKHVHLSDSPRHLDAAIAITPEQLRAMTKAVAHIGTLSRADQTRYLTRQYPPQLIAAVEGGGGKRLAATETPLYPTTNRSIRATAHISRGDRLTDENCAILRGESLGGGLPPNLWARIRGARAQSPIPAGRGVTMGAIIAREEQ